MKIYIVRHGETPWNKKKLIQGQQDIPLNDYGRELAKKTGEGLKDVPFDRVFSSPLQRAYETAEILIEGRNLPIETDDRLKEIKFGAAEGRNIIEARADKNDPIGNFFDSPADYQPVEGGETFDQVRERGMEFLKERILPLENQCENVLMVAHACIIRSIVSGILELPLKEFWAGPPYKNCCVAILSCENGIVRVEEEAKLYYELSDK